MDKELKIVFACVATYAVLGLNTFGFKYHRDTVATDEHSRHTDAAFAGLAWPFYWSARWSLQFWELPPAVTNVVHVTNYVDSPVPPPVPSPYGGWFVPSEQLQTNAWPLIRYNYQTNVVITNSTIVRIFQ